MERIRTFGPQIFTTTNTASNPVTIFSYQVPTDIQGVSALSISIVPSPLAYYKLYLGRIMQVGQTRLPAIWELKLEHLTSGVYANIFPGDVFLIQFWSPDGSQVTTAVTGIVHEVLAGPMIPSGEKVDFRLLQSIFGGKGR